MKEERWARIEKVFHEAGALAAGERAAYLAEACEGDEGLREEVEALLAADGGRPIDVRRAIEEEAGDLLESEAATAWAGKRLGPWRVTGLLGQGGMGAVYSAERADGQYECEAAIKVLRLGMITAAEMERLRQERRILARLEHANIARLLDGGEVDGTPYIVMERVEGIPITEYCRERGLGLREKLALFLQVAEAVEYAHQRLVLHRDLKPENILVTGKGEVKLLDFGVAKLLESEGGGETAATTQVAITPEYASPEQIRGEALGAATDVYSLGVVLYELLGGRRPYSFRKTDALEMARVICETNAPALGMGRDLDTLLGKAMEKDAGRRYGSVGQMAEDVRRYLGGRPLLARKSSTGYRLGKFVQRNRVAVGLAGLAVVSLVAGLTFSVYEARQARRSALQVRQLANALIFEVYDAIAKVPGATKAREVVISRALSYMERLEKESPGDAELQYELGTAYRKIGDVTGHVTGANLGDMKQARKHYREAERLLTAALRNRPGMEEARVGLVEVLQRQGQGHAYAGEEKEAKECYRRALEAARSDGRVAVRQTDARLRLANLLMSISDLQRPAGDAAGAMASSDEALKILRELHGANRGNVEVKHTLAVALSSVARSRSFSNDLQGASAARKESIGLMEEVSAAEPENAAIQRDLLLAYGNLGDLLGSPVLPSLGDRAGAEAAYRKALTVGEAIARADGRNQRAQMDLAIGLSRLGHVIAEDRQEEALAIYERALGLFRALTGKDPNNVVAAVNMGSTLEMKGERQEGAGDLAGAERTMMEARATCGRVLERKPGESSAERVLMRALGAEVRILIKLGRRGEAEARAKEAVALAESSSAGRSEFNTKMLKARAYAVMAAAQSAEACRWNRESLKWWQAVEKDTAFNAVYERERDRVRSLASACG